MGSKRSIINQQYEDYWKLTLEYSDFCGENFNNCLQIIIDFMDKNPQIDSKKYHELQEEVNKFNPKADLGSVRKSINQFFKLGFINNGFNGYHTKTKQFLSEQNKAKKKILYSEILYDNASFSRSYRKYSDENELKFLVKTIEHCGSISKENLLAIMYTTDTNIYYANLEDFSLKNENHGDKINVNIGSPRQDREKIKHFKNCTVTLGKDDSFDMISSYNFEANNSSFNGNTMIKLMPAYLMPFGEAEPDMSLKVNNSLFSNACVSLTYSSKEPQLTYSSKEPQESVIESSEIKNHLRAKDLFSVSTAFLDEVQLANVSKINTMSLQNYINVDNPSPIVLDGLASSEDAKRPSTGIITNEIEVL